MIQKIIELIIIRFQIYVMQINEMKIEYIDINNQFDVIKYLQKINASFHLN